MAQHLLTLWPYGYWTTCNSSFNERFLLLGMELVHPRGHSAHALPDVPWLGYRYDGPSFWDFTKKFVPEILTIRSPADTRPLRDEGFKISYAQPFRWDEKQLAFAQAWLYLGLLTEILNEGLGLNAAGRPQSHRRYMYKDFLIQRGDGHTSVVSRLDLALLKRWKVHAESLKAQNQSSFDTTKQKIRDLLTESWEFASRYLNLDHADVMRNSTDAAIQTSIVILGQFLDSWTKTIYGNRTLWTWPPSLLHHPPLAQPCPYNKLRVQKQYDTLCSYYLSSLLYPQDTKDHGRCTQAQCNAYQLNEEAYPMKETCSGCKVIGPDIQQVKAILQSGGIPIISMSNPASGVFGSPVEVTQALGKKYVAISHVWSDGLGNPKENKIHHCQLQRLRDLVATLPGIDAQGFWLDSLCIPKSKDLRRIAIMRMKETYSKATCVLVLDSSLEQIRLGIPPAAMNILNENSSHLSTIPTNSEITSAPHPNPLVATANMVNIIEMPEVRDAIKELIARIVNTGWMRRLWTFQEARLASKLLVQFTDGVLNLSSILVCSAAFTVFGDYDPILTEMSGQLLSITNLLSQTSFGHVLPHVPSHFGWYDVHHRQVFNGIAWRATSWAEDTAVCLGAMFDVEYEDFLNEPLDQHIPKLLLRLEHVPKALLFDIGPKHDKHGFLWCPKSLLNSQRIYTNLDDHKLAKCTSKGLEVQLPGWILLNQSKMMIAQEPGGFSFKIQDHRLGGPVYYVFGQSQFRDEIEKLSKREKNYLVLLVQSMQNPERLGVCVKTLKKESGVLYTEYVCPVSILEMSQEDITQGHTGLDVATLNPTQRFYIS